MYSDILRWLDIVTSDKQSNRCVSDNCDIKLACVMSYPTFVEMKEK